VKKILAGVVGGAAALAVIFGAGSAVADNEYKGRTYAQVQESTNNRAVISSRVGSYLPTEECIVTGNRRATDGTGSAKILVDLNCNDTSALNGHPGNSVASPAGKKALEDRERADNLSKNYARAIEAGTTPNCLSNEGAIRYCINLCNQSKTCSVELLEALGQ
jgi:hypothetical protein